MNEKIAKERKGKELQADTAELGGGAYAPHDQEAEKLAEKAGKERKPDENAGDNRTPDKTIGEIKYAKKPDDKGA